MPAVSAPGIWAFQNRWSSRSLKRGEELIGIGQMVVPGTPRDCRLLGELPVRLGLLISQKFHRHAADGNQPPPAVDDLPENTRSKPITCARRPRSSP